VGGDRGRRGAVGLLLGGVLVQELSWRWVFFVNVPIGALLLAAAPRIVPESRSQAPAKSGYDLGGAVAITLGVMSLVFTLIKANSWGWASGRTIGGFVVAAVLVAAFLGIESRHPDPLVPLRIFRNRSLAAADVTLLLVVAALFAMFFFLTLYLQQVLGFSALKTGVAYLPLSLTIIVSSGVASQLVDRLGPKPVLVTGLLISTGGFIFLATVSGGGDYGSHVAPSMVILGIGMGMGFVPVTIAGTSGVAPNDSGLASGLLNTTQQVGGSLGLAILSSIATSRTTSALHSGHPLTSALTHGFKGAFIGGALLCALGAFSAIALLPGRRREPTDENIKTLALSFARCPGAPYCGYLARAAAFGRRLRSTL
jgi:EmrB/QacA subfamily drug resistance transporter